jgi:hypothetical protein
MGRSRALAAVIGILCFGIPSGASGAEVLPRLNIRNAETRDILGDWNLVSINSEDPKDKEDPRYQRWIFKNDGVLRHIASTSPITETDVKANETLPPNTSYTIKNSMLEMRYKEPLTRVSMRCFVVERIFPERMNGEPEKKGDLILAAYRKGSESPDVMWILRKQGDD